MRMDDASCYRALTSRDMRFDGVFFVGVTSTRIYCRPVCPVKPPRRENCRFYNNAAAAERAGFRPCLRCRPELAPGTSSLEATNELATRAAERVVAGALNGGTVDELAGAFDVTARHLRRAVSQHLGVSLIDLATTQRLLLAKRLLHETTLPIAQVAYASGFESLRRFNDAFKGRYRLAPAALRKAVDGPVDGSTTAVGAATGAPATITLSLEYRTPLDWGALLTYLAGRATPGLEQVIGNRYARTVRLDGATGHISVEPGPMRRSAVRQRPVLRATVTASLVPVLMPLLARLRDLFDLDADPRTIVAHLTRPASGTRVPMNAGIRVPGTVDGFELTVRAILGQQVSVRGATTIMTRYVRAFGDPYSEGGGELTHVSPAAARVAALGEREVASLGMPGKRAATVIALAERVASGALRLDRGVDVRRTMAALTAIPGIGDWTAHYVGLRALRWPDAFPAGDLGLRKAAGGVTAAQLAQQAETWRPWRGYAAISLWQSLSPVTNATKQ